MSSVTANVADPVSAFCSQVDEALETGKPEAVPDESLQRVLSAAVRLYAAKSEDRARELPPFGDKPVNATEAVTAICAIMRAADINFFDLQMWYRRGERECLAGKSGIHRVLVRPPSRRQNDRAAVPHERQGAVAIRAEGRPDLAWQRLRAQGHHERSVE